MCQVHIIACFSLRIVVVVVAGVLLPGFANFAFAIQYTVKKINRKENFAVLRATPPSSSTLLSSFTHTQGRRLNNLITFWSKCKNTVEKILVQDAQQQYDDGQRKHFPLCAEHYWLVEKHFIVKENHSHPQTPAHPTKLIEL